MSTDEQAGCEGLFLADAIYAYRDSATNQVIIVADVTMNPAADQVRVCPNPLALRGQNEFLVLGTRAPGVQPTLDTRRRLSYAIPSDPSLNRVVVYSAGIDAPRRTEVAIASVPPPALPGPGCTPSSRT